MTAASGVRSSRMPAVTRSTLLVCITALVLLLVAGWGVVAMWRDLGVSMSIHGWIAYGLGGLGSIALSAVLFWLLFHSARHGHDDIERPEDLDR